MYSQLQSGDILVAVNNKKITSQQNFIDYINSLLLLEPQWQPGFCLPNASTILNPLHRNVKCCVDTYEEYTHQCFSNKPRSKKLACSVFTKLNDTSCTKKFQSLMVESAFRCSSYRDLHQLSLPMCVKGRSSCDNRTHSKCIFPVLDEHEVMTRLTILRKIGVPAAGDIHNILYVGPTVDILYSLQLVESIPSHWIFRSTHYLPKIMQRILLIDIPFFVFPNFCYYTIAISIGVAFLNALPIWTFDGAHVLTTLITVLPNDYNSKKEHHGEVLFEKPKDKILACHCKGRNNILHCVMNTFSGLLILNILASTILLYF